MVIHEAAENYLETIYMLRKKNGHCRSIDVATDLGYSKPTVSIAMRNLRASGHVLMDDAGELTLTPLGLEIAQRMYERHEVIASFLISFGVPEKIAYHDACKIEHDISPESFDAIKRNLPAPPSKA